jgi:hypothetical protein
MPVESTQAFAMTRRGGHEHPGIRNDKKERSRADRLEVVESCIGWREWHVRLVIARSGSVYKFEMIRVKATKQSRMWHVHILSLRGAAQLITLMMLSRKRRSNLGCDV